MKLRVPGFVFAECLDPYATGVPKERGWPDAVAERRGYGCQYVYDVETETAHEIVKHVHEWASGLTFGVDPDMAATTRRMVRWAEKIAPTLPPRHDGPLLCAHEHCGDGTLILSA